MLVRFLETHNTEEAFATNRRQTYFFDWLRSGNRQAWFTDVLRRRTDEGLYYQVNATSPVDSDACLELQNQMLAVSQKANPISSNSIFVPNLDKEKV